MIKFKDLSAWVKLAVLISWISLGYWAAVFFTAFFIEMYYLI